MTSLPAPSDQPTELDSSALLSAAEKAGYSISNRMLAAFRAQGLVPHPRRAGYRGRAPVWLYPPGTDRQLVSVLRYRALTKDQGVLRVLLWLDGFHVPADDVRRALLDHMHRMGESVEQAISTEASRLGLNPAEGIARSHAVDELARTMAAKRGSSSLPRRGRVRARERGDAIALLIRAIGLGEPVEGTPGQGDAVERTLGVAPNGRRHSIAGAQPWLTGPAEDLFSAADLISLPRLLDAATHSTENELETARKTVTALFRYLPLAARMIDVLSGRDNYAGLASFEQVTQHPEIVLWLVPAVVAMFKAGWSENLNAITDALQQFPDLASRAQALTDMPASTVAANLAAKPEQVRKQAERIINAAIDGPTPGTLGVWAFPGCWGSRVLSVFSCPFLDAGRHGCGPHAAAGRRAVPRAAGSREGGTGCLLPVAGTGRWLSRSRAQTR